MQVEEEDDGSGHVQKEVRRLESTRWADEDVVTEQAWQIPRGQRRRQARHESAQSSAGGKPCQESSQQEAAWVDDVDQRLAAAEPYWEEAWGIVECAERGDRVQQLPQAAQDYLSKLSWPCSDKVRQLRVAGLACALAGV